MTKNVIGRVICKYLFTRQNLLIMKLAVLLLTISSLQLSAKSTAQKISLSRQNATLGEVLNAIHQQTGYLFLYDNRALEGLHGIDINVKNVHLQDALEQSLTKYSLGYMIEGKTILVFPRKLTTEFMKPSRVVKGTVADDKGKPLAGVTIRIRNSNIGTITDKDGKFSIEVPGGSTVLEFSFLGFKKIAILVGNRSKLSVVMSSSTSELDQLVVVGYGTTAKKDLTGSISSAPIEDMAKAPVPSFVQALEGRLAGVVVSSPSAQPGQGSNIVIRGNNSITQANSPLYVVDGFPQEDYNQGNISPDDIASIDVLKDASATAIYGARGANGVIIITTKQGKEGPPVITLNASYGFQNNIKTMDVMDPFDFVKYQLEVNPGDPTVVGTAPYYYLRDGQTLSSYKDSTFIDWQDKMFRTAPIQNYNMSVRGGSEKTKYSLSGNVFSQDGIIINSDYARYQGRIRLDQEVNDKVKVGINANYTFLKQNGISPSYASKTGGSSTRTMMYSVWGFRPFGDLLSQAFDPNVSSSNDYRFNPVLDQQNIVRTNKWNRLDANAYFEYQIVPHLQLRVTGGIYSNIRESIGFNDTLTHFGNSKISPNGINGSNQYTRTTSWVNENTLTYKNTFNKVHDLNVVVGFTDQKHTYSTIGARATYLPDQSQGVSWLGSGTPFSISSGLSTNSLASFLGRVNYGYKSKYLATFSFRADGSSKFSPDNRWSYFPSGALAWRFGNEDFIKNITFISNGKLRASYGVTGNNRVGDFDYLSHFNTYTNMRGYTFQDVPRPGMVPSQLGNYQLRWETTAQTDIGLDMGFLKNKIALTVDVYRKKTTNLLLNTKIPASYGYGSIFKNIGSVLNEGLEISLNTRNIHTKNFSWNTGFNISFNKNKVLALAENQHAITNLYAPFDNTIETVPAFIAIVDRPMGLMYGPIWDGVYQYEDFDKMSNGDYVLKNTVATNGDPRSKVQPGDIKYKDLNGDGEVDNKDFTVIGRGLPIHTGGLTNNFTYKGFDLSIFFQWSYGNDMLNANRLVFEGNMLDKPGLNQFKSYVDRWTPNNPSNTLFRPKGQGPRANMFSTRVIEDGSYLRLKTVSLGYNIPKKLTNKWSISNLRVYVAAQNVLTWTNYTGMDPEVSIYNNVLTPGVDFSSYPRARIVTFGLKVTF